MPTKIEWTDETWNPLIGCSRISEGCDHCYAIGVVHRAMSPQHVGLTVKPEGAPTDWTGEVRAVPHLLDKPLEWNRPRRIFVNSLSDLFHDKALGLTHEPTGFPFIAEVVARMVAAERHTFQVLTKRPQIMAAVLDSARFRLDVNAILLGLGHPVMPGGMTDRDFRWPENIWWGVSIETDRFAFRANHLRQVNGVRWISAEPLLGPLPSLDLTGIDWLVAGGESGPGARPMHPAWVRDLRDRSTGRCSACGDTREECEALAVTDHPFWPVAFHFKQWGEWCPAQNGDLPGQRYEFPGLTASGLFSSPEAIMRRAGKKASGRVLDGRTWDEWPA